MNIDTYFNVLEIICYIIVVLSVPSIIYIELIELKKNNINNKKFTRMEKIKLNDQVLSKEQCNHLKDLGLNINGALSRITYRGSATIISETPGEKEKKELIENYKDEVSETLTLQEILRLLPDKIDDVPFVMTKTSIGYYQYEIVYVREEYELVSFDIQDSNILEAAYQLLCWVLENDKL